MMGLSTRQLQLDVTACTSAISTTSGAGRWLIATLLLTDMSRQAVKSNEVTVNSVISACEQAGQWSRAMALLSTSVYHGLKPDVVSCNTALSSCTAAPWRQAAALFAEASNHCQRDMISYNAMLGVSEKGGLWQRGLQLLGGQLLAGMGIDIITVSANVGACARAGEWEQALMFPRVLLRRSIRPNIVPFSMAVDACDSGQHWQAAASLVLDASLSMRLDAVSLNSAMKARASWRQSWTLLEHMRVSSLEADLAVLSTAVDVAAQGLNWPWALLLFANFHRLPRQSAFDLTFCNSIIAACDSACLWAHVLRLAATLQRHILRPDILTVSSVLHACDHGRGGVQVQEFLGRLSLAGLQSCRQLPEATR